MPARSALYLPLAGILVASSAMAAPSHAGAKKPLRPRVVTITYSQPCGESPQPTGGNGSLSSCPADQAFHVLKNEKHADIQVTDGSGRPGSISFNVSTTGVSDQLPTLICGSASGLEISGGQSYVANPTFNVGDTNCPTPPTSGTIKITLRSS